MCVVSTHTSAAAIHLLNMYIYQSNHYGVLVRFDAVSPQSAIIIIQNVPPLARVDHKRWCSVARLEDRDRRRAAARPAGDICGGLTRAILPLV